MGDDPDWLRQQGQLADAALGYARLAVRATPADAAGLRLAQAECWAELGEDVRARRAFDKALALGEREELLSMARQHPQLARLVLGSERS